MEVFKTQFLMSEAPTDVTVKVSGPDTFACTLNLADFFEGGEMEADPNDCDVTLKRIARDEWTIVGDSKISLNKSDLQNLGNAIERDYLSR